MSNDTQGQTFEIVHTNQRRDSELFCRTIPYRTILERFSVFTIAVATTSELLRTVRCLEWMTKNRSSGAHI